MATTSKRKTRKKQKSAIKNHYNGLQEILTLYPAAFWTDIRVLVDQSADTPSLANVKPISDRHKIRWSHCCHAAHLVWLQIYRGSVDEGQVFNDSTWLPRTVQEALDILSLKWPCTLQAAKQAYRNGIRNAHPDTGGDKALAQAFNDAWQIVRTYIEAIEAVQGGVK